ncbi:MAG: prephenate dehydratase [Candidatus Sumerlaeia bacterium]|nr:prephenate dehydratase [Candidatus Sumerlaeia bacterium]
MADLDSLRQEIDSIDAELVRLIDRRMEIAREVGKHKASTGTQTYDAGRHHAVIEKAVQRGSGACPPDHLRAIFRDLLSISLHLQKPLKVAYLGPAGTFSHQAALREFGSAVNFEAYDQITEVFTAVQNGWTDYGIVPVENSTGGIVHESLDSFIDYQCSICHEVLLPIRHSILGNLPLEEVKVLYSHPQPFLQCSLWLKEHMPHVEQVEMPSTVAGMQKARSTPYAAAIGSSIAADFYGLRVLVEGVEDNKDNTTRFLVIGKTDTPRTGDDKTSLMFTSADKPGALYHVLKPFAERNINLSKIESRPTKKRAWEYVMFVDLLGHRLDEPVKVAIAELEANCLWFRVLGSYPREKGPRHS